MCKQTPIYFNIELNLQGRYGFGYCHHIVWSFHTRPQADDERRNKHDVCTERHWAP